MPPVNCFTILSLRPIMVPTSIFASLKLMPWSPRRWRGAPDEGVGYRKKRALTPTLSRKRKRAYGASHAQQHAVWILELVLDIDEEQHRVLAVDDAVVVGQRDVHHRRGDDLAVLDDRALLDGVHAEDRALRRVDDRRRHQRAEGAAVGDGERAALQVLQGDL